MECPPISSTATGSVASAGGRSTSSSSLEAIRMNNRSRSLNSSRRTRSSGSRSASSRRLRRLENGSGEEVVIRRDGTPVTIVTSPRGGGSTPTSSDSVAAQKNGIANGRGGESSRGSRGQKYGRSNSRNIDYQDSQDYYDVDRMELASPTSSTSRTRNTASLVLLEHQPVKNDVIELKRIQGEMEAEKRKQQGGFRKMFLDSIGSEGNTTTDNVGGGDNTTISTRRYPQWKVQHRRKRLRWIAICAIMCVLVIASGILWRKSHSYKQSTERFASVEGTSSKKNDRTITVPAPSLTSSEDDSEEETSGEEEDTGIVIEIDENDNGANANIGNAKDEEKNSASVNGSTNDSDDSEGTSGNDGNNEDVNSDGDIADEPQEENTSGNESASGTDGNNASGEIIANSDEPDEQLQQPAGGNGDAGNDSGSNNLVVGDDPTPGNSEVGGDAAHDDGEVSDNGAHDGGHASENSAHDDGVVGGSDAAHDDAAEGVDNPATNGGEVGGVNSSPEAPSYIQVDDDAIFAYDCVDAQPLVRDLLTFGSTRKAPQTKGQMPICTPQVAMNGRGVWYKMTGNNEIWTIETCYGANFDTQISIYEGSCNDDSFVCVVSNDQFCDDLSSVTFFAKWNVQYFVYIHGYRNEDGEFSYFASSKQDTTILQNGGAKNTNFNDNSSCEASEFLELAMRDSLHEIIDTTRYLPAPGSLLEQSGYGKPSLNRQPQSVWSEWSQHIPAKWYKIVGWGNRVTVSTCSDTTNYVAHMRVLQGQKCNDLYLLSEDSNIVQEDCPNEYGSIFSFDTVTAEKYYVMVLGADLDEGINDDDDDDDYVPKGGKDRAGASIGDGIRAEYGFMISDTFATNQYFINPIQECRAKAINSRLEPNSYGSVEIGVLQSRPDLVVYKSNRFFGTCGDTQYDSSSSHWYTTIGTGVEFTASTCNSDGYTTFDTQITIFTGDCDDLICIAGNDNSPDIESCGDGGASTVSWDTVEGEIYFILIHGVGARVGSYGLTLSSDN